MKGPRDLYHNPHPLKDRKFVFHVEDCSLHHHFSAVDQRASDRLGMCQQLQRYANAIRFVEF